MKPDPLRSPYYEEVPDTWGSLCRLLGDSPSGVQSIDMRAKRPLGDFRTQGFEPPLEVEAFPAEAPA